MGMIETSVDWLYSSNTKKIEQTTNEKMTYTAMNIVLSDKNIDMLLFKSPNVIPYYIRVNADIH